MSHDLTGFRPLAGETIDESLDRLGEPSLTDRVLSEHEWSSLLALSDKVSRALSEPAERLVDRDRGYIELTTNRLDVSLYADSTCLSLHSWATADEAANWEEAGDVVAVMQEAGFVFYDQSDGTLHGAEEFYAAAQSSLVPLVAAQREAKWRRRLRR